MYQLYYHPGAASFGVHWLLLELGVDFELVAVDVEAGENKTESYLALNPMGRVPALVFGGQAYLECAALLLLLGERHPDAGFVPRSADPERSRYLQWMFFLANTVQPAFRRWFYPHEAAGPENVRASMDHAQVEIERAFQLIDDLLKDDRSCFLGETFTTVDILATMLMRWSRNMPRPATSWPNIARYLDVVRQRPALRLVHEREDLTDWIGDVCPRAPNAASGDPGRREA